MIGVITDLLQSTLIIVWCVIFFFLIRHVNRLDKRLDQNSIAVAQVLAGRYIQDPQPVCGCGHHQCFHDEAGCGSVNVQATYATGSINSLTRGPDLNVPCGCKRYTGPEPLPTVIP